jgi:hypothetical protein
MRLVQYLADDGTVRPGQVDEVGAWVRPLRGFDSIYELASAALQQGQPLDALAQPVYGEHLSYPRLQAEQRLLCPLTHPDPAHCHVSGTGLTHLGSAETRDAMHRKLAQNQADLSDSMRMFQWGLQGGRPRDDTPGVQPEWFYKGDGGILVHPGQPLRSPRFALNAGEEPELVGLYLIDARGQPHRLGFAIGNEFSDHVTERQNYLYLAHSKLRQCSLGPELRTGPLPDFLEGRSRIRRDGEVLWQRPFLTGEANMCHSLANLEYHHFKYAAHCRPGDVHLHFFGTATLSFADGITAEPGDCFEIELPLLGAPLVNPLQLAEPALAFGGVGVL